MNPIDLGSVRSDRKLESILGSIAVLIARKSDFGVVETHNFLFALADTAVLNRQGVDVDPNHLMMATMEFLLSSISDRLEYEEIEGEET